MEVHDSLTSGYSVIDTDVVALRLKLFVQQQLGAVKQRKQVAALLFG